MGSEMCIRDSTLTQREFGVAWQAFYRRLTALGCPTILCRLPPEQLHRTPATGIPGPTTALTVMLRKPALHVDGNAGIEAAINALQQINHPRRHRRTFHIR